MTAREVVVDGHNAAHALRLAGGAESVRDRVATRARAAARRGTSVTVFFDGHPGSGAFGGTEHRGVTLRFAGDREADEAIVDHVRAARRPHDVTVVTNDLDLSRRVEQLGAVSTRIDTYFRAPSARRGAAPRESLKSAPAGLTPADFGLPDEIDLAAPPPTLDSVKEPGETVPVRRTPRTPARRRRI